MTPKEYGRFARQLGEYTGLALTLPAAGLIGYAIGSALDDALKTGYLFTLIFLFVGCAAGLIEILRVVSRKL